MDWMMLKYGSIRTGKYISENSISLEFPKKTEFVAVLTKF